VLRSTRQSISEKGTLALAQARMTDSILLTFPDWYLMRLKKGRTTENGNVWQMLLMIHATSLRIKKRRGAVRKLCDFAGTY
jgi:hypothetical protein